MDDENNKVSPGYMAHWFQVKVEIVLCLVSGIWLFVYRMTLWIPHYLGSVSGVGYHLYKDLFEV